jgi:hypothetical protein
MLHAGNNLDKARGAGRCPKALFVGTKNVSGSIQNQHVHVVLAIIHQSDVSWGKGFDERLATRAIHVAVQPDAEGV